MQKIEIETLFDYNYWANRRIRELAGSIPAMDLSAPAGLSHGSLMDTLVHILYAEWIWRMRCAEGHSPGPQKPWDEPLTFDLLAERWLEEESGMRAFLAGLKDADLAQMIRYKTTSGELRENRLWQLLAHLVNHGTQHRSEAAVRLTALGRSPGDLDLIVYLRGKS
jgi:uncharacterized damage-inducible protein DinB